jgi:8-oxo-dGTP pyrophosphatase MutT (NUDIX family)
MTGELADRLRRSLHPDRPAEWLVGDMVEADPNAGTPAAVLIAITDSAEPGVILTVRREHLRTHPGQVAFPGGRIDPGEDAVTAALREAHEELVLDPRSVAVVGTVDPYCTVTNYRVTPVIGVIPPGPVLLPHDDEVADWFEAPLAYLLDPANQSRKAALFQGRERHYYEIIWKGWRIWGATAGMIVNLTRRLRWN